MAKRVTKTKKMSEAIKPTLKKAPKKVNQSKTVTTKVTKQKPKPSPPTKKTTKVAPKKKVTASLSRKRSTPKKVVEMPVKSPVDNLTVVKAKPNKHRIVDSTKYIKISTNSKSVKFIEMGDKIQRGEVKWVYYTMENNIGYHYYLKLK